MLFPRHAAGPQESRLESHARRDAVKPRANGLARPDVRGAPREDEEDGLEGILGVLAVPENPVADAVNEGAVASHQLPEGGLASGEEAVEQAGVTLVSEVHDQAGQAGERCVHRPLLPVNAREGSGAYAAWHVSVAGATMPWA